MVKPVTVLGATSLVGHFLLKHLVEKSLPVVALTRKKLPNRDEPESEIIWQSIASNPNISHLVESDRWISLAPIWVLPGYFSLMQASGIKKIIAVSSTSVVSKLDSQSTVEKSIADRLKYGEKQLIDWASKHDIDWVIFRPTLIYGLGRDENISRIAGLISRYGFFPLLGKGCGMRQPIHGEDVASYCVAAIEKQGVKNRIYTITGGEIVCYREMVGRIFSAIALRQCMVPVPRLAFKLLTPFLKKIPRFRSITFEIIDRVVSDLVYDGSEASRDLSVFPRSFLPEKKDVIPDK